MSCHADITLTNEDAAVAFDDIAAAAVEVGERLPRISMVAYSGGVYPKLPGYPHPVIVDLAGLDISNQRRPIRFNHGESSGGIGHTEHIAVENGALVASGVVSRDTYAARDAVKSSKRGFPWQASIGASPLEVEMLGRGQSATVNGRAVAGPLHVVRRSKLNEISLVDLGADDHTSAVIAASQHGGVEMSDLNCGATPEMPPVPAPAEAPAAPAAQPATGIQAAARPVGSLEQISARHRADIARQDAITGLADRYMGATGRVDEIKAAAAHAIETGMPFVEFENFCLHNYKQERVAVPSSHPIAATNAAMLECGLAMALGVSGCEKHYGERVANAADQKWGRGLTIGELLITAARANGEHVDHFGRGVAQIQASLKAALAGPDVRASVYSTINLPGILQGAVNRLLGQSFLSVEDAWRSISRIRPVNNFLGVTSYAMGGSGMAQDLGPGGELKHGNLSETTYTNRAKTRGEILMISMEDIVNDDLGAFSQMTQQLMRRAALKLNDVFWREFLRANSTFYTTGRGNYASGGGTALDMASLKAASTLFSKQTDPDGHPLGMRPAFLVVPPELEFTALELMNSTSVNTGGSATTAQVPNRNVLQGRYRVVTSAYLSDVNITGYSTTAWFLVANPNDCAVIETVFYQGRETPTIQSVEPGPGFLGIGLQEYHAYGVAQQEYRAAVKYAGA